MRYSIGRAVLLTVLVLCLWGTAHAQSGGWSRNCPVEKRVGDLNEGTYSGDFDVKVTAKGGPALMNQAWTLWIRGTVRFVVNEIGNISNIEGDSKYQFGGSGTAAASVLAGINFDGGGALKMDGPLWNDRFSAVAKITAPGSIFAQGPGGGSGFGGVGAGDLHLHFKMDVATCDKASGTFTSPEVEQTITALQEQGFVISGSPAGTWTASAGTDMAQKVADLQRELAQKAPAGIVRRRDDESRRLGAIADRIKQRPAGEQECLFKVWEQHVRGVLAEWVWSDVKKLRNYGGDVEGLEGLMKQGLEADKQLSLIGRDQCEAQLHDEMWSAIESSLSSMLNRMVKSNAPVQDIMKVMRQAQLLGNVAPALEQRVVNAILAESKKLADAYYQDFRMARQNHPKDPCHPDVVNPWRKAIAAEREWELMSQWGAGGPGGRSMAWLKELGPCGAK